MKNFEYVAFKAWPHWWNEDETGVNIQSSSEHLHAAMSSLWRWRLVRGCRVSHRSFTSYDRRWKPFKSPVANLGIHPQQSPTQEEVEQASDSPPSYDILTEITMPLKQMPRSAYLMFPTYSKNWRRKLFLSAVRHSMICHYFRQGLR